MGRKHRRDDKIGYDRKEWRRTPSGQWEHMYKKDNRLEHEKASLKKDHNIKWDCSVKMTLQSHFSQLWTLMNVPKDQNV